MKVGDFIESLIGKVTTDKPRRHASYRASRRMVAKERYRAAKKALQQRKAAA